MPRRRLRPASPSQRQTRLYLKYAATDTAIGVHWDFLRGLRGSRRRLQSALNELARSRYVSYSLAGVLRESYALPDRIHAARTASPSPDAPAVHRELIRILRRTRMRARRVLKAMADLDAADAPAPAPVQRPVNSGPFVDAMPPGGYR